MVNARPNQKLKLTNARPNKKKNDQRKIKQKTDQRKA